MPYTIKPGSFKYKKSNGQFSEIDCFEGPDLTEEVAALEKGKAPIIIDSAVGNPIVLTDGADGLPVEGVKIHFLPKQNLNGQDAPYPPGGGANKLPCPTTASTQTTSGVTLVVDGNGQYKISGSNNSGSSINFTFNVQSQYIGNAQYLHCMNDKIGSVSGGVRIYLFNDGTQVDFVGFTEANRIYNGGSALNGKTINKIQIRIMDGCSVDGVLTFTPMLLDASSVTDWTPYSNICPISGWTGINAWRTGKNLLALPFAYYGNAQVSIDNYFFIKAGTYIFSFADSTADSWRYIARLKDKDGNVLSDNAHSPSGTLTYRGSVTGYTNGANTVQKSIVLTIVEDCFIRLLWWNTGSTETTFSECQLEPGSTAFPYAPHTGQSYPVTFPETVYGGTLDAVNGVIRAEYRRIVADGTNVKVTGGYGSAGSEWLPAIVLSTADKGVSGYAEGNLYASYLAYNQGSVVQTTENTICMASSGGIIALHIGTMQGTDGTHGYSSADELKTAVNAYLAEHNLEITYKLATPIEIQLDPITIKTLLGDNTIWSDANGDIELDYRADTKLFVDNNNPVTDVQVKGTSLVQNGIADIPLAQMNIPGLMMVGAGYGLKASDINGNSAGRVQIDQATSSYIKGFSDQYHPITPKYLSEAVFQGLAKAAGDSTQSASSNAVGTFTPDAIVAIQKMLGVYQAPWELIREDTFTNDTEANHVITVDSNGQPLQLTDVILYFETPVQDTYASKGVYGQLWFNDQNDNKYAPECGSWKQSAGSISTYACGAIIEQKDGMFFIGNLSSTTNTNNANFRYRYMQGFKNSQNGILLKDTLVIIKTITIPAVTGTGHYILYGKRKWTT